MSWIDVLVIIILVIGVARGFMRGLILTLTSIVSFIASIIIAGLFYKDVALYIADNTGIGEKIQSFFIENLSLNNNAVNGWTDGSSLSTIPEGAKGFIDSVLVENANSVMTQEIPQLLSQMLIQIIVFILIFFSVRILFYFAGNIVDGFFKLPGLSFFNKIGGGFVGILEGAVINVLLISLLFTLAIFSNQGGLVDAIDNSIIAQYFYLGYIFY